MNLSIYIYDNDIGIHLPEKIDTYPLTLITKCSSITSIHNNICDCQLFCVFTKIQDADIIVQSESDVAILKNIIDFGKYQYKIECHKSSIWFTNKAAHNMIISDRVKLSSNELYTLLKMYINEILISAPKKYNSYRVINFRNGKQLMKTPDKQSAIAECNNTPCSIVVDNTGTEIYRTKFGKVSVSKATANKQMRKYNLFQQSNTGVFKVKL